MPSSSHLRLQDDRRSRELHVITNNSTPAVIPGPLGPRNLLFANGKADSSPLKRFGMTEVGVWLNAKRQLLTAQFTHPDFDPPFFLSSSGGM